jgi:hypothetical protein
MSLGDSKSKTHTPERIPVFELGQRFSSAPSCQIAPSEAREMVRAGLAGWCNRSSAIQMRVRHGDFLICRAKFLCLRTGIETGKEIGVAA